MATQDSIDKIINIRFNYKELVQGWVKANEAIEDNKKILSDLKKEYETGQISLSDYKKAQLELKSTTKALTDEQRQYEKEIQNNIKVEKELDGSLNQLRANLNGLIAQYGRLSAAERESASGKALVDHIKAQRDAVKHLLQEIQKLLRHKVTFLNPPVFHGRWDDHLAAVDEPSACHWKTPKSNPLRSPFSSQFSGPITVFAPLAFKSFTSASGSSLPVRSRAVARDCTAA